MPVCVWVVCPGAGAEEGFENVPQANWFKTFCKCWERSLKEFAAHTQNNILKKSAGHAHREDAILE